MCRELRLITTELGCDSRTAAHASDCVRSACFRRSPGSNVTDTFELQPSEERLCRPEHPSNVVSGSTPTHCAGRQGKAEHHAQVERLGCAPTPQRLSRSRCQLPVILRFSHPPEVTPDNPSSLLSQIHRNSTKTFEAVDHLRSQVSRHQSPRLGLVEDGTSSRRSGRNVAEIKARACGPRGPAIKANEARLSPTRTR